MTVRNVDSRREWIDADAGRSDVSSSRWHAAQAVTEARASTIPPASRASTAPPRVSTLPPDPPPAPEPLPVPATTADGRAILALGAERFVVLDEVIGCGERTIVYRGELEVYGVRRLVAVKIFDGVPADERAAFARRLDSAASRAERVVHPNVVATYDQGIRDDGAPFVVTALVEGTTLDRVLLASRSPLEIDHAVLIVLHAANALAAAWSGGELVHGALCARDVFVSIDGAVKIADFGLSDATWESASVRTPNGLSPRLAAAAPEIAAGASPSAASDVFALGILLHELVAGPRFTGSASIAEAIRDVHEGTVRENPFALATLPLSLRAVMRRALERDPALRFPDAHALATALGPIARPLGVRDSARMPVSSRRGSALLSPAAP